MIKKYFPYLILLILVLFSFFYTEKTISVVKQKDPIMIELTNKKDQYKIMNIEGIIEDNTFIPGINGCEIDIDKSYYNLKRLGTFNSNLLSYKVIHNINSVSNNYDKYIISGNTEENYVSILFKVFNGDDIDAITNILDNKKVQASFFMDGLFIENNIDKVNEIIKNYEIYPYGYNGLFEEKDILYTNSLIFRIKYDNNSLCLNEFMNEKYFEYCKKNKISSIMPLINSNDSTLLNIKKEIDKGSIIVFNINEKTIKDLNLIVNYIFQKGYNIKPISKLISEERNCQNN